MTETRIRELFAHEADDILVRPAPELDTFVAARRRSRTRLAAASVGLAAATAGVVVVVTMSDDSPGTVAAVSPTTSAGHPTYSLLQCHSDRRSLVTWDGIGPYRHTPQGLAMLFANPIANEHVVVQSVEGHVARALMLRGDGSPWARLNLDYVPGRGWQLETAESCPGRYVRTYWQHQRQP